MRVVSLLMHEQQNLKTIVVIEGKNRALTLFVFQTHTQQHVVH